MKFLGKIFWNIVAPLLVIVGAAAIIWWLAKQYEITLG